MLGSYSSVLLINVMYARKALTYSLKKSIDNNDVCIMYIYDNER